MRLAYCSLLCLLLCLAEAAESPFTAIAIALPDCSLECSAKLVNASACYFDDLACLCRDTRYQGAFQLCTEQNCDTKDTLKTAGVLYPACGVQPRDRTPTILGVSISFFILSVLVIVTRLVVRYRAAIIGPDDAFIAVVLLLIVPFTAATILLTKYGIGKDIWDIPVGNIYNMLRWYWINELIYISATSLTKISVLCFYLKLFPERAIRQSTYATLGFAVGAWIAFTFAILFQCTPVSLTWKKWDGEQSGHCDNIQAGVYAQAISTIVIDIPIILIPLPRILSLKMKFALKMELLAVFSLGLITTIVTILRLVSMTQFAFDDPNFSYNLTAPTYLAILETHVGILCVCLPALRPLLKSWFDKIFGTSQAEEVRPRLAPEFPKPLRFIRSITQRLKESLSRRTDSDQVPLDRSVSEKGPTFLLTSTSSSTPPRGRAAGHPASFLLTKSSSFYESDYLAKI